MTDNFHETSILYLEAYRLTDED